MLTTERSSRPGSAGSVGRHAGPGPHRPRRREVSLRVLNDPRSTSSSSTGSLAGPGTWSVTWLEIPKPGDYVQRYIGEDAVIVVRHEAGGVNICRRLFAPGHGGHPG